MRVPLTTPSQLTPEQQPLYDDMKSTIASNLNSFQTQTEEGALVGPWSAWITEPVIGGAVWNLAKVITTQATLPNAARQIAILVVGSHFKAAYELYAHIALSQAEGMSEDKVTTLAKGLRPASLNEQESTAYDVAHALVNGGVLPEAIYTKSVKVFGQHGTNELTYLVGVYCLVSVTLNGFDIPAPTTSKPAEPVVTKPNDSAPTPGTYQTINPTTGKIEKTIPETSDAEVAAALDIAHDRYENDWSRRSVAERAAIVGRAATILRSKLEEYAAIVTKEMGKLIDQSRWEVMFSADILEYYATHAEAFLESKPLPEAPDSVIATAPIGVILAIEPWNFPYYQLARVVGPQLVVGNVAIMKHAPSVPQCALAFARLFEEAGAPQGVYTNLFCSVSQISDLIDDFRVRGVTLTGSELAGSSVAEQAGRKLKKVVLELGGSDPYIVLEDADLEKAISQSAMARLVNMGQGCVSSKRFIVVGKERGAIFLDGLVKQFESLQVGDPADRSTSLGPLVSERAIQGLLAQINGAKANGARIVTGGKRIDRPGFYLEPTIITDISKENPLYQQETFGPVASFYVVNNEEEAIKLANDTKFGLGSSIWSTNIERARKVADQIESGMVFINSFAQAGPESPFGGVKNSGYGRELGELGIGEFVNRKLIKVTA
ncbi:hypothetical protein B7463_g11555, partial [Scytalidium lignicola]